MRTLPIIIASAATLATASAADLPFHVLETKADVGGLPTNAVITPLTQLTFTTAATVSVDNVSHAPVSKTDRASNAISKVYLAVVAAGTAPSQQEVPLPPPAADPGGPALVEYEDNHDAAQAWATMSETGAPFMFVYADGQSHGKSTASWSARYVVQGGGDRDVYIQFTVPAVSFGGRFLDRAVSPSWARLRVDLLVDAYPAWSTESYRFNEFYQVLASTDPVIYQTKERVRVDTFGNSIGLDTQHQVIGSRKVSLKLGKYPTGKALDFTLLFQGEAKLLAGCGTDSEPKPGGGTQDITVCSGASVKVSWDPTTAPPTFFSKPGT